MRHVQKRDEPEWFIKWKTGDSSEWKPSYEALKKDEKDRLKSDMLDEQGWTCCYCGGSVTMEGSHIEHFRPQKEYRELALDYSNLYASCIREPRPNQELHCGHAKGDKFDEELCISPSDAKCESCFIYTGLGRIFPKSDADAKSSYMIDLLKLDAPLLRSKRKEVLRAVFDLYARKALPGRKSEEEGEHIEPRPLTEEEIGRLADAYSNRDDKGHFATFAHVVVAFARQMLSVEPS